MPDDNTQANTYEHPTRRRLAFRRFADANPRYMGGFLVDCFWDEAAHVFGSIYIAERAGQNDPRWDKVQEVRYDQ